MNNIMKKIGMALIFAILLLAIGGLLSVDFVHSASWNCIAETLNGRPCPESGGLEFAVFHSFAMQKIFTAVFSFPISLLLGILMFFIVSTLAKYLQASFRSSFVRPSKADESISNISFSPYLRWLSINRNDL